MTKRPGEPQKHSLTRPLTQGHTGDNTGSIVVGGGRIVDASSLPTYALTPCIKWTLPTYANTSMTHIRHHCSAQPLYEKGSKMYIIKTTARRHLKQYLLLF